MRWWFLTLGLGLIFVLGCSSEKETIPVTGVVQTSAGKPVTGVRLILEPVEGTKVGTTFGFDLDNEGHFSGSVFPATYAFYLSTVSVERDDDDGHPVNKTEAGKLKASSKQLKALPPAYWTTKGAGQDRMVVVDGKSPLTLTINK